MPVYYNSNKIIPAPFASVSKTFIRNSGGGKIGSRFIITLIGTLVAFKGSPDSDEAFWNLSGYPADETDILTDPDKRLMAILRKQEALRNIFSTDGYALEIQPLDGSAPLKCYPRIQSIEFGEGTWYDISRYTIVCEADQITGLLDSEDNADYISSSSETWDLTFGDNESIYNLTHSINAQGTDYYNAGILVRPAWENARNYVQPKLGLDAARVTSSGALNLSGLFGFNHVRSEQLDEEVGTYSVNESWVLSSGAAVEDFNISTQNSLDTGLTSVNLDGTITGLNTRDGDFQITQNKYQAASGYYNSIVNNFFARAQLYSNVPALNPVPLGYAVARNPIAGTIQYTFQYDTRPANTVPDSLIELTSLTDNLQADVFAEIPVIGRAAGPILQNMNTKTRRSRSLSAEVHFAPSGVYSEPPDISALVSVFEPVVANTLFVEQNVKNWDFRRGVLTQNISWTWEP